jgi:hypothetical protein
LLSLNNEFLKKIFHFILSHFIFIALCAVALSLQTYLLLHHAPDNLLLLFIFFASLAGYNSYCLLGKFSFHPDMPLMVFLPKESSHSLLIAIGCIGMLFCLLHLHLFMYNILITFFLLALYSIPVLPFKQFSFTKKAGFAKTILLCITWTHVTTMIPMQKSILSLQSAEVLIYIEHFLFLLMLCIIFDKRDVMMDAGRGLHSLATDLSSKALHYIVLIIFILLIVVIIEMQKYEATFLQSAGLFITAIITLVVYHISNKKRGYFFYSFLVDGLMLFSGLLTYLLSI